MMTGYWNDQEATARTIKDGWLHTGDLAVRDRRGFYHLVGRRKAMIRRSGENVAAGAAGLVSRVGAAANLLPTAPALTETIGSASQVPVGLIKQHLRRT